MRRLTALPSHSITWVYKSWRDWNAKCNLSQAQIKRVYNRGFLEAIGIERKTMKANCTSTVHYRLDETQREKILQSLEKLGVNTFKAKQLIATYGHKRIAEVVEHTLTQKRINPAGYVVRIQKAQWILCSKPINADYAYQNGQAYITGPFADFIEH